MYRIIFKLCIVLSIVSPSLLAKNNFRKYNVEEESFKLYGEDFNSVLKKFRRTPAYLAILQDKLTDIKISVRELSMQVLNYYYLKMEEKLREMMPQQQPTGSEDPPRPSQSNDEMSFFARGYRRQDQPINETMNSTDKILALDNYKVFSSGLSVSERNKLKDMGFEYAGKIIHTIIDNLFPESAKAPPGFTHIPEGGQYEEKPTVATTTTTTHPPEHKVTHEPSTQHEEVETVEETNTTPEVRFRANEATSTTATKSVHNTIPPIYFNDY